MTEAARPPALSRLLLAANVPSDGAWLAVFRFVFGLALAVSMLRFIAYGWIDVLFVRPSFHFKYWLFPWVEPLSALGMHRLFWALFALALCLAFGVLFRLSALLFTLGFTYLQLIDVATYLNHYYLASLLALLLTCSPAGRVASVDAWLWPKLRVRELPRAWLWLFRLQVAVVYSYAGLAKAHGDWLFYAQPLRIWLGGHTDMPLLGPLFRVEGVPLIMSWAGFLFDTCVPWFLLFPRTRLFAYAAVIGFHALTRALFPIGMFPVIMVLSALVFFPPAWPRAFLAWVAAHSGGRSIDRAPALAPALTRVLRSAAGRLSRAGTRASTRQLVPGWALALMGLYALVQVLLPLRCFAYGGDVRWHEQGMRFSWRVMVREKNGSVTFYVRQKSTGREFEITPRRYLTLAQEREMAGQPDLILQFAHFLRDDFARRGYGAVSVRADALVSLNGRPMARMIDPGVDLAAIEDGLAHARFVLPAPSDAPPLIRPI
jgi:vitamin K-dependent gamma-carboxylase